MSGKMETKIQTCLWVDGNISSHASESCQLWPRSEHRDWRLNGSGEYGSLVSCFD